MKLIAVYNVFDGAELLRGSIKQIRDHVDEIYAVVQTTSYNGIKDIRGVKYCEQLNNERLLDKVFEFNTDDQFKKRQRCLDVAIENGATHFIMMDCDEYYEPKEFAKAKEEALKLDGSYCKIKTYFGRMDLTIGLDNYFVPFIHPVKKGQKLVKKYPVMVDPRRRLEGNAKEVDIVMHHFSWVRDDIELKVNAHGSKKLILQNNILEDYYKAKEGNFVKHYNTTLKKTNNIFNE